MSVHSSALSHRRRARRITRVAVGDVTAVAVVLSSRAGTIAEVAAVDRKRLPSQEVIAAAAPSGAMRRLLVFTAEGKVLVMTPRKRIPRSFAALAEEMRVFSSYELDTQRR